MKTLTYTESVRFELIEKPKPEDACVIFVNRADNVIKTAIHPD